MNISTVIHCITFLSQFIRMPQNKNKRCLNCFKKVWTVWTVCAWAFLFIQAVGSLWAARWIGISFCGTLMLQRSGFRWGPLGRWTMIQVIHDDTITIALENTYKNQEFLFIPWASTESLFSSQLFDCFCPSGQRGTQRRCHFSSRMWGDEFCFRGTRWLCLGAW